METYVIHVTKECNMNCLYCYEKDKTSTYTWEEVKGFIDAILENRTSNTFGIEFLGGEPMLAWEHIRKAYEYLESFGDLNIDFYGITTNGTIMNEEIADYLSKNKKIYWAVSLDGHKYANQLRVFKDNDKNSYDAVIKNLELVKKAGVDNYGAHMVIHPYNVGYIYDSMSHLYLTKGISHLDPGIIESTMTIDENFARTYIKQMDKVSEAIVNGELKGLSVSMLTNLKPKNDVRTYLRDENGKLIGETYGRSGNDVTDETKNKKYHIIKCDTQTDTGILIGHIRETVYVNHQNRLENK